MTSDVLIWDSPESPPLFEGQVYHWRSVETPQGVVSIPAFLEKNALRFRQRYLAFIHDFGMLQVRGQPLSSFLQDGQGNNFWWMSLLAEKSPFKTPEIYHALRLMVLEEILRDHKPTSLSLRGGNADIAEAMRLLCGELLVPFSHVQDKVPGRGSVLRRMVGWRNWPAPIQGLVFLLAHLYRRWPLRKMLPLQWQQGPDAVYFGSYFAHLDLPAAESGRFYSRQWGPLPDLLGDYGIRINWLQNFWPGEVAKNAASGVALARSFNDSQGKRAQHGFVDSYLGWEVVGRALRSWLWLCTRAWSLRGLNARMKEARLHSFLWPVLRKSWRDSFYGRAGLFNCLSVQLFDAALRDIPKQTRGLYLFENQSWEKAFLAAWRRHGHGQIFGVAHSTVPFWHLYYAQDPRSLKEPSGGCLPLPYKLLVNGEAARSAFLSQGYPAAMLIQTEALRYLGLAPKDLPEGQRYDRPQPIRILILGEMEPSALRTLLSATRDAARMLGPEYQFAFKPHPAYAVDTVELVGWGVTVVTGDLFILLNSFDCVVSGNSTSASVDAFLAGKPVIIGHSGQYLNLSPLRGQSGVAFFESSTQLVASLRYICKSTDSPREHGEYFHLNENLLRWRQLLGLPQVAGGHEA